MINEKPTGLINTSKTVTTAITREPTSGENKYDDNMINEKPTGLINTSKTAMAA